MELSTFELTLAACGLLTIALLLQRRHINDLWPVMFIIGVLFLLKAYFQNQDLMLHTSVLYLIIAGLIAIFVKARRSGKHQPSQSR